MLVQLEISYMKITPFHHFIQPPLDVATYIQGKRVVKDFKYLLKWFSRRKRGTLMKNLKP